MLARNAAKSPLSVAVLAALAGCAGSTLVKIGNFNAPANVNQNRNANGNANNNANANGNANANQNDNRNANGNGNGNGNGKGNVNGGVIVPPDVQGFWVVAPDCGGGFTMTVMADGSIDFEPIDPVESISGRVTFGNNFDITIIQVSDIPPLPGQPPGQCTIRLTGMLSNTGQVNGNTTRSCTGEPVGTPCSYQMLRL